jgi:hypothetical protein
MDLTVTAKVNRITPGKRRRVKGWDWRLRAYPETATARTVLLRRGVHSRVISLHALSSLLEHESVQFCTQKHTKMRQKHTLNAWLFMFL